MVLYLYVNIFYTGIAFEANIPVNQLKCNQLSITTINLFGFCHIYYFSILQRLLIFLIVPPRETNNNILTFRNKNGNKIILVACSTPYKGSRALQEIKAKLSDHHLKPEDPHILFHIYYCLWVTEHCTNLTT